MVVPKENYFVNIGKGTDNCEITELLDNQLKCQPPYDEPSVNKTGDFMEGKPRIYVNIIMLDKIG